mmetsp:Transcript_29268/g.84085  ORF Transcript_29268/g.84085 Transcript_29268/m.84085 type:complete len:343 (-) Transcript_29268:539-1567(-)
MQRRCEQRLENVSKHLGEILHLAYLSEHRIQSRHLNQPTDLLALDVVRPEPLCQLRPLVCAATIDGNTPLSAHKPLLCVHLHHLLGQLGHKTPFNVVVRFEENVAEPLVAERIVLVIEDVKAPKSIMLAIADGRHATQAISGHIVAILDACGVEHLPQLDGLTVLHGHHSVHLFFHFPSDELHQLSLREGRRVVNVSVYLSHLVEVPASVDLLALRFSYGIPVNVQLELHLQLLQARSAEGDASAVSHRVEHMRVVRAELTHTDCGVLVNGNVVGLRISRDEDAVLEADNEAGLALRRRARERVPCDAPVALGDGERAVAVDMGDERSARELPGILFNVLCC